MRVAFQQSTAGARLLATDHAAQASVTLGGMTLGFVGWYELLVRIHYHALLNDLALLLCLCGGVAAAFVGWYHYSIFLTRHSPYTLREVLHQDAWSWFALTIAWLGFWPALGAEWMGRAIALAIGLFALTKLATAAKNNATVRDVATTFIVTRLPLFIIAELAAAIIGQRAGIHVSVSTNPLLAVWGRWDSVHYVDISRRGYYGTDMAFFPLYPALIAALGRLIGNHVVAGLLLSNTAFFIGLFFLYQLVEHDHDRNVAHRAVFYTSIFPTAIFFSAVYTESLFFALTVAAFYAIRRRAWMIAGIVGCFAALTRVEGILLIAPLLIEARALPEALAPRLRIALAAATIGTGLAVYMLYLWALQGDPLYFSHVQIHWNRHLAPPWTSIIGCIDRIIHATSSTLVANQMLELSFTIFMITLLIAGRRYLKPSFTAYAALSILVPMSTSSLMSMPRFALVLFPLFIILAIWGRRPVVNNTIVAFSLPLLGLFTALFADWYWVA